MNFMNLSDELDAKFVILPIEFEKDTTYGKGASKGPSEIIKASQHLEYYDEQFDIEPHEKGIRVLDTIKADDYQEMFNKIKPIVDNKFIIGLGGDHSVTIGMVNAIDDDFSAIVLDAHSDFRDQWNNSEYNHACVSKQLSKKHSLALIGIRSMDIEEHNEIKDNDNVHLIKAYDYDKEKLLDILPKLKDKVYISIDVDCFDPSFIRNTGTPEPGGFFWNDVIEILQTIFEHKKVIGADIVEFSPKHNFEAEAFALAKLCYKLMSLKLKFN